MEFATVYGCTVIHWLELNGLDVNVANDIIFNDENKNLDLSIKSRAAAI